MIEVPTGPSRFGVPISTPSAIASTSLRFPFSLERLEDVGADGPAADGKLGGEPVDTGGGAFGSNSEPAGESRQRGDIMPAAATLSAAVGRLDAAAREQPGARRGVKYAH